MTSDIRAVLFDLDGTLVDTAPDLVGAVNTLLVRYQRSPVTTESLRPWVSQGGLTLVSKAFGLQQDSERARSLWAEYLLAYQADISRHSRLFDGMQSVLVEIEKRAIAWGIVTNKPFYLTDLLLKNMDLEKRAGCVVCGDTLPRTKPWPDPVLHACKQLSVAPINTIMIGDDQRDIAAGHAAGTRAFAAAWGYIRPQDDPATWQADGILQDPESINGQLG